MEQQSQAADRPKISVIIASVSGRACLSECLESLERQTLRDQAEVIVANSCGIGIANLLRGYSGVRLLSFDQRKTIPELLAVAMKHARGDIIAVTEDHCLAEHHWYERILAAHQEHHGAIGGAVENGRADTVLDWAEFLCEYYECMSPVPKGEVGEIPGNNASYPREFLAYWQDLLELGYWGWFLHQRLREKGVRFYSDPSIVVVHKISFGFADFLSQRFHFSRSFAAQRTRRSSLLARVVYAGLCPFLPIVVLGRIGAKVWQKGLTRRLLPALPLLVIFSLAWAWGEFRGYLLGPGDSTQKVGHLDSK